MTERPSADQQILLIDDIEPHRDTARDIITGIDSSVLEANGIRSITVAEADSVEQAEERMESLGKPSDLAVLDLRLPIKSGEENPMVRNGFRLLQTILEKKKAKGVLIISNYGDYQNVRQGFKGGAIDFINKPLDITNFEPAVVNALLRVMTQDAERLLNQRIFDLVAHSQLGLAHGFRQVFFTLLKGVTVAAEGFERDARDRFGVDSSKDPADLLALLLNAHREAIEKAREDWAAIQAELAPASSAFDTANVSEMLHSIRARLEPALVVKRVVVTETEVFERRVHTFEKDVEVVLGEIVAGALSELKDPDEVREIKLAFKVEDTRVGVVFEDDLDPIPERHAGVINEGLRIITDANFGRAWGLSVAQHVALRGGGEIKVATKHGKNVVTYYIPLADHA